MTIFLIVVFAGMCIWLILRATMPAKRKRRNHGETAWPDQSSHDPTEFTNLGLLHQRPDASTSYTDNVSYSDSSLSNSAADSYVAGLDDGLNTDSVADGSSFDSGGTDSSGVSDSGGFDGGGDFGGGGAGGDWSSN